MRTLKDFTGLTEQDIEKMDYYQLQAMKQELNAVILPALQDTKKALYLAGFTCSQLEKENTEKRGNAEMAGVYGWNNGRYILAKKLIETLIETLE